MVPVIQPGDVLAQSGGNLPGVPDVPKVPEAPKVPDAGAAAAGATAKGEEKKDNAAKTEEKAKPKKGDGGKQAINSMDEKER